MSGESNRQDEHWKVLVFLLDEVRRQEMVTLEEVAAKAGITIPAASRFFKAKYKPSLPLFLSIANSVEVNFFFESKNSQTDLNIAFEAAMDRLGRRPHNLPKN